MPVIVMKCVSKQKHPHADSLFVYEFEYNSKLFQIIANETNVYEIGDKANIAYNCLLKTGENIREGVLRGIRSNGMALGHSDKELYEDLTDELCQKTRFVPWPSIGSLFNVIKDSELSLIKPTKYRGKIKLDGTNAAIQVKPDGLLAQSRTKIITINDDNYGFAKWLDSKKLDIADDCGEIIIFGEWCGPGIQNSTSISKIPNKIFAIFAIVNSDGMVIFEPDDIAKIIKPSNDVFIIPWLTDEIELTLNNREVLDKEITYINELVASIDNLDPWVSQNFGIDGVGEGLVMYPINNTSYFEFSNLVFKAKGEQHKVVNSKKPVQVKAEAAAGIDEFCNLFVTENRLNQIAGSIDISLKNTGLFLKSFLADVQKESTAELAESNLTFKEVSSELSKRAKNWWMQKANT